MQRLIWIIWWTVKKKKNSKKATCELGASASFSVSSGSKKFEMFNDQNIEIGTI